LPKTGKRRLPETQEKQDVKNAQESVSKKSLNSNRAENYPLSPEYSTDKK